ncbi:MAG: glycosyltransferase family 39 protein [Nanoarchaeota archaeon]
MGRDRIAIIIILAVGLLIRFIGLGQLPPSLNWDEVSHGYNAYSILRTGKDEWGEFLPLTNFRAYGDYPLPVNLYLTIPSIALFGLNEFGIRFPHAILGTAIILSTYFLVYGLKFGKTVALLAALFVAIDPWMFFPSRAVFQSNVASFFLITGVALFLYRKKHFLFLPTSAISVGLSLYSYHNTRIFVPLLLLVVGIVWFKEFKASIFKQNKVFISSLLILIAFLVPLYFVFTSQEGRARSKWVFLLDEGSIARIIEMREKSNLPEPIDRLLYNRYSFFISEFGKNFIGYFSPRFLFTSGGSNYQFSVPDKGILYPINAPFFYVGLTLVALAVFKKKRSEKTFLFFWLILGLIPASITQGEFHVIRATTIVPLPQIFVALGLATFWAWFKQQNLKLLFSIIYVVLLLYFMENYAREYVGPYRTNYSWSWQYGYKEAVQFIKGHYNGYNQIIMTKKYGEPHEFLLFYWPWDPEKYRQDPNLIRFAQSNWYWVDRFDKFYFVNDWEIPRDGSASWRMESGGIVPLSGKTLLITSPGNYPSGWRLLQTINFLDNKPAFDILEKTI